MADDDAKPFRCALLSVSLDDDAGFEYAPLVGREKVPSPIWSKSSGTGGSRDFHISAMLNRFLISLVKTLIEVAL